MNAGSKQHLLGMILSRAFSSMKQFSLYLKWCMSSFMLSRYSIFSLLPLLAQCHISLTPPAADQCNSVKKQQQGRVLSASVFLHTHTMQT